MALQRPELTVWFSERVLGDPGIQLVKVDGGMLPSPWTAYVSVDQGPWWGEMDFVVADGKPVLQGFSLRLGPQDRGKPDAPALDPGLIRVMYSKPTLDEVVRQGAAWTKFYRDGEKHSLEETRDRGSRRGKATPVLLELVAEIAAANPTKPSLMVSRRLHVSHRTASRYMTLAKEQGFLTEEAK
jgi:hypothetical protein